MSRNRRTQRTLAIGLTLVACLQSVASFAQVSDKTLNDDQAPQGVRDSAVDRVNAEGLAQLKDPGDYLRADEQDVETWREMKFGLFTRWAADAGTKQAWLEVDLGQPTTFNRTRINEEFDRVQEFELQYKEGDHWRTFAHGTTIGSDYSRQFESVTARRVRLNILNASDAPSI